MTAPAVLTLLLFFASACGASFGRPSFSLTDVDNSGFVSLSEWRLRSEEEDATAAEGDAEASFKRWDVDADDEVDETEFEAYASHAAAEQEAKDQGGDPETDKVKLRLSLELEVFDTFLFAGGESGGLDAAILATCSPPTCVKPIPAADAKRWIAALDGDGDGEVTRAEMGAGWVRGCVMYRVVVWNLNTHDPASASSGLWAGATFSTISTISWVFMR